MDKTYPKKMGAASLDDVVYYLEEKMEAAIGSAAELPELPDNDGEYFLQLTKDGDTATLSWETLATGE